MATVAAQHGREPLHSSCILQHQQGPRVGNLLQGWLRHLDHIDEVIKVDDQGRKFKRFYIHFKEWAEGWEQHRHLLMKDNAEFLKVTYDSKGPNGGWFLKVYANRATKFEKRDDEVKVELASKVETTEEEFPKLQRRNSVAVERATATTKNKYKKSTKKSNIIVKTAFGSFFIADFS